MRRINVNICIKTARAAIIRSSRGTLALEYMAASHGVR